MSEYEFDPRTLIMDCECYDDEADCDFSFAFNDSNFSDRLLRICIISSEGLRVTTTLHISSLILAARSPFFYQLFSSWKRDSRQCPITLRINAASEEASLMELLKSIYSNSLIVTSAPAMLDVASCTRHCNCLGFQPPTVATKRFYDVDHKDITSVSRAGVMDSPEDGCDFGFGFNDVYFSDRVLHVCIYSEPIASTQSSSSIRVKTLNVSSPILAARSPFFYKLFSNGMRESRQCYATLRINDSEEAGFMELLKFMYSNKLTVTSARDVLDVLIVADKFDVASCMRHCVRLLRNLITTPESVLAYLDLPSTILMADCCLPLTVAAKQFYAVHQKDITKFEDEILSLPLAAVEAIIASNDLKVTSEYAVYRFVCMWARAHYPDIEDRRKIIKTRLAKFIRYPFMRDKELVEVIKNNEFDDLKVIGHVSDAIWFQEKLINKRDPCFKGENAHRIVARVGYKNRHVKMQNHFSFHWAWFVVLALVAKRFTTC